MKRSYTELVERVRGLERSLPNVAVRELGGLKIEGKGYDLFRVDLAANPPGGVKVCISTGMHGDEPAGVEAALRFIERSAGDERLLKAFSFTIFPCDNPSGYELGTRENALGIDLNREFDKKQPTEEVRILMEAVEGTTFDHVYELHEDVDSYGFYLYELAVENSLRVGMEIVRAVSEAGYPVNLSKCIEGLESRCGVIAPGVSRMRKRRLPKAVHMYRIGARHVVTMETPARGLGLEDRVRIHLMGLEVALGGGS